ncbi:MAG TPA: hypothetical protein VFE58_03960 [Tepidisphaeraceae bacterium]|jgi:hypothetical protein|nr:hypothetical protein [Tepidisphaeraceae bacterium]
MRQGRDSAVAVGDLDQEQPQRHQRREQAATPEHLLFVGQLIQTIGEGKIGKRIALEARKQLRHVSYPWPL